MNNYNIYTIGIADNYDLAQPSEQNFRKYDDHIYLRQLYTRTSKDIAR